MFSPEYSFLIPLHFQELSRYKELIGEQVVGAREEDWQEVEQDQHQDKV